MAIDANKIKNAPHAPAVFGMDMKIRDARVGSDDVANDDGEVGVMARFGWTPWEVFRCCAIASTTTGSRASWLEGRVRNRVRISDHFLDFLDAMDDISP